MIDYDEFVKCYATLPWSRIQGLSRLLNEIKVTWKLFDQDGDGSITTDELRDVFGTLKLGAILALCWPYSEMRSFHAHATMFLNKPLCVADLSPDQIERMIRVADVNKDGEISYQEFVEAFHSRQWKEVRRFGDASRHRKP